MNPNGLRNQAKQLEQQAADMERQAREARAKADRQAFWRGEVVPKLIFILGVFTILVISGRCSP